MDEQPMKPCVYRKNVRVHCRVSTRHGVAFDDRDLALAHCPAMHPVESPDRWVPYRCEHCGRWHLTPLSKRIRHLRHALALGLKGGRDDSALRNER